MNRTRNWVIMTGWLAGVLLLGAAGAVGAEEAMQLAKLDKASDKDQLSLYFSDENLVEVTTRAPQPLPRVAENVTIITAEQIEEMGIHSVDEVLAQLPGMIVAFDTQNFGDNGTYRTHGLGFNDASHVLLLIDGVRLNPPSSARAETNGIPLQIIKRIEVIKGPASSVWGSALGGVINIITKDTGKTLAPQGQVSGSYGEAQTQDYGADIASQLGRFAYYLYAGRQDSQGLRDDRWFTNNRFYGKANAALGAQTHLGLALGYSQPDYLVGNFESYDYKTVGLSKHTWGSLSLDSMPITGVNLRLALQGARMEWWRGDSYLSTGDYIDDYEYADKTWGGEALLAISRWSGHRVLLGAEIERDHMRAIWAGFDAYYGVSGIDGVYPIYQEKRGVFINDSLDWGALTITPGIRHDYSSLIGEQISPSFGAAYRLDATTLLRLTAGRGFAQMPLLHFLSYFNPNIKPEKIKSVQGGVETRLTAVRLKATLFHHAIKDTIDYNTSTNTLPIQRDGVEAEIETQEFAGFAANLNVTYVHERNRDSGLGLGVDGHNDEITAANLAFSYRYEDLLRTRLSGHYIWFDAWQSSTADHDYSPMLWDWTIGVSPRFFSERRLTFFGSVHNLFNGTVYRGPEFKNPGRWVEAGVLIRY